MVSLSLGANENRQKISKAFCFPPIPASYSDGLADSRRYLLGRQRWVGSDTQGERGPPSGNKDVVLPRPCSAPAFLREERSNWSCRHLLGKVWCVGASRSVPLGSLTIPTSPGRSVPISLLGSGPGDTCGLGPTLSILGLGRGCQPKCSHTCHPSPPAWDQPQQPWEVSHPHATFLWAQLCSSLSQSSVVTSPSSLGTSACRPFTPGPWTPRQWAEAGSRGRPEKLGKSDSVSTHQERKENWELAYCILFSFYRQEN